MSKAPRRNLSDKEWQQLPIPRRFQVITWQINVSYYPPGKSVKLISSLRDPIENTELLRAGHGPLSWHEHQDVFMTHLTNTTGWIEDVTGIHEPF